MNNISSDGTVVEITLKVKDGAQEGDYKISAVISERDTINVTSDLVSFISTEGIITVIDYIVGDVNGDGYIANADVLIIFRYIYDANKFPLMEKAADVTHDGCVTNADVLKIFRYIYNPELYPIA